MNKYIPIILTIMLLSGCIADIDPSVANTPAGMSSVIAEFLIIGFSMLCGYTMIVGGIILILLGASGNMNLFLEGTSLVVRFTNASPGVIIALIGAWIVYKSRINIRIKKDNKIKQK